MTNLKIWIRIKKTIRVLRKEGLLSLIIHILQKIQKEMRKRSERIKIKINFLAQYDDVLNAKWATHPYKPTSVNKKPPFTINWVMSPPRSGGGHQNILRFIKYLEDQGHSCRIYLYSSHDYPTIKEISKGLPTKAPIEWLDGKMAPADAVFATGWETAYPVFNDKGSAKKFYFVQDFEPYFYPVGTEYILAENTYHFNFFGITAGGWLAHKLNGDYGMPTENYEFGADTGLYKFENKDKRREVFFYARPVTARRGFELGIMALQLFHEKMPDYTITLAGWDVSEFSIPFPYKNLKTMPVEKLSEVYNQCAAGLVVSLTNMSLLPLELLATGVIPVLTDGPNTEEVSDNAYIKYAHPSPDGLAQALIDIVSRPDLPDYAAKAADSVKDLNWGKSLQKFEEILTGQLNG